MLKSRFPILIALPLLLLAACEERFSFSEDLSLDSVRYELGAGSGQTPVIVHANGEWKASLDPPVAWAHLEKASGKGLGQLRFVYDENEGLARKAVLKVKCSGITKTIDMVQKSGFGNIEFGFADKTLSIARSSCTGILSFSTNLPESEKGKIEVSALSDDGTPAAWLSGLSVTDGGMTLTTQYNGTGASRAAVITLSYTDEVGDVYSSSLKLTQTDQPPYLSFDTDAIGERYSSLAASVTLHFTTNLAPFLAEIFSQASSSDSWAEVRSSADGSSTVLVDLSENNGTSARECTLTFPFTDADGSTARFTYVLTQKGKTPRISFADVRSRVTGDSYEFLDDAAVECVAICDAGDPNLETAPNLTATELDRTQNAKTGYVQNYDGTLGFRLKFASESDNILQKGDSLLIDLHGLTVKKESEPERYTIEGLTLANISVSGNKAPVVREIALGELQDSDLYTLVKVKDVEFSFKHGAYTNCHDGYSYPVPELNPIGNATNKGTSTSPQKYDTTPCSTRDAFGNELNLLINNAVTWRRYGNGVPQGTCDITGIVVHTDIIRWARNGWLGRYQLRPSAESDIEQKGERFSHLIAAWYKGWGDTQLKGEAAKEAGIHPEGAGVTISSNMEGVSDVSVLTVTGFNDPNNMNVSPVTEGTAKGQRYNAALGFRREKEGLYWASNNTSDMSAAPWFQISCSTAGLSGSNLVFIWSAAQGLARVATDDILGPTQYKVEYSTDGSNFTAIDHIYAMHPVVSNVELVNGWSVPGLHQYVTVLPASLLGQQRIYVRVRAASNISADADYRDPEGGTVAVCTQSQVRFGEFTLEYN